jgi:release factor glutamine methyltransferase
MPDGSMTDRPAATDAWTTRRLLDWMHSHFDRKQVDSPRLCGELLLAHVIGCERLRLYMEIDRPADRDELERLRGLVQRVAAQEPIQYVTGDGWFYGRPFRVDPSTLIPRPSTETLVERAVRDLRAAGVSAPTILDVGTGTGCIGITLALECPGSRIVATDIAPDAVALARVNAARHGVSDRFDAREGSLFEPLAPGDGPFDVVVSNPPYVPDHEWPAIAANVRDFEPPGALRGGADGLEVILLLLAGAPAWLKPGGRLYVEIAHCHREPVTHMLERSGAWDGVEVIADHEQLDRVAVARRR